MTYKEAHAIWEKNLIEQALKAWGGNITRTADGLDIHRNTLYQMMRRHGITV